MSLKIEPNNSEALQMYGEIFKINYGVIVNARSAQQSNLSPCVLESRPIVKDISGYNVKYKICKKMNESFLLENNIDFKCNKIPNEWLAFIKDTIKSPINPLTDETPVHNVYIEIQYQHAELLIDRKPSKKFELEIIKALENTNPYQNLMNVFSHYGHFMPKMVKIGFKLYRMIRLLPKNFYESAKIIYDNDQVLDPSQLEENNVLRSWEDYLKPYDFDTTYLVSTSGDIIKRENLSDWLDYCKSKENYSMQIIDHKELFPIYEIFDESIQAQIKSILGIEHELSVPSNNQNENPITLNIRERVLMTGVLQLHKGARYYHITFSEKLQSSNYMIFGKLITENGQQIKDILVKFKSESLYGFSVLVEAVGEYSNMNLENYIITWIMIGIPSEIGYYSTYTREIYILNIGKEEIHVSDKSNLLDLKLNVCADLPKNSIFTTSFEFPLSNNEPQLTSNITLYKEGVMEVEIKNIIDYTNWDDYVINNEDDCMDHQEMENDEIDTEANDSGNEDNYELECERSNGIINDSDEDNEDNYESDECDARFSYELKWCIVYSENEIFKPDIFSEHEDKIYLAGVGQNVYENNFHV
ncbi:1649_t:CDS:2 [Acaulospora morrowiae]|uniref:1649_t:CDS:1 n=1 Tax=Acaulospora morrowiae TaxID=94023 RepID=A0A9N8ZH20_9GLOM|nr:1649_t:CDS:2 [Acaulospora morrowiae]